jgi:putative ATP-dependent endonuclease of OLD family
VNITLDDLTILIGENNTGKTSFLDALLTAIGASRRNITEDDIYLAPGESKVPKDRKVIIDVLVHPIDEAGATLERFPEGSYWLMLWSLGVSQDDEDNDFVGIRTEAMWDSIKGELVTERRFLKDWQIDPLNLELSKTKNEHVSQAHIEPFALYYMDAKRDLQDELRNRGSFLNKLISDLGLEKEDVEAFEKVLGSLNEKIVSSSEVLGHLNEHLNSIDDTIGCGKGSVSITPLPLHLRDLKNGMDVSFSTAGAQSFPLTRHSMGTRCLAALMVFRAYTTWRQKKMGDVPIHSMLALEEPEAHLHPQAQRALFKQIGSIPGQRIVSTHSPYIVSQADISSFRHFKKVGSETKVSQFEVQSLNEEDLNKINRKVMSTRGDLLFARALILFEGETEEQALPVFAEYYWGRDPQALGISLISVNGYGAYVPFVRLAKAFDIPWYILSDGEPKVVKPFFDSLKKIGADKTSKNIFVIPEGKNYERYLACEIYKDIIIDFVITMQAKDVQQKQYVEKEWEKHSDPLEEALKIMCKNKTEYARPLAEAIVEKSTEEFKIPPLILSLFKKMDEDLGL